MNELKNLKVCVQLMATCAKAGVHLYIYHTVNYKNQIGSIYLKHANKLLRSVRIGDHPGREQYRYKWNLRADIKKAYTENDNGATRYYYPYSQVIELAKHIVNYANKIM